MATKNNTDDGSTATETGLQTVQVDVHIDAELWGQICVSAREYIEGGKDPVTAFADARNQHLEVFPNLRLNDECVGAEDLPGVDLEGPEGDA